MQFFPAKYPEPKPISKQITATDATENAEEKIPVLNTVVAVVSMTAAAGAAAF